MHAGIGIVDNKGSHKKKLPVVDTNARFVVDHSLCVRFNKKNIHVVPTRRWSGCFLD